MSEVHLTLPWPPTLNMYWRRVGNRTLISKDGRKYRQFVQHYVAAHGMAHGESGRMAMDITAYQPDRRKRDLDNLLKAPLDAMQHSGVYEDDSLIDELRIARAYDKGDPRLEIVIRTVHGEPDAGGWWR